MTRVSRRAILGGFATFPLVALVSSPPLIAACGSKPPETPLAHLYGRDWIHGAYKLYADRYVAVQVEAEERSTDAYRVIAQKGVVALDAVQARDVPFFIRVDPAANAFAIERKVPERLMFTAAMTEADRKAAQESWARAREHIHTDYEEIRRLDWALTRLLGQLQHIRNAIEEGRVEQYRLVEQLAELKKDPTQLPYQLPFQVTQKDYEEILLLLLERLEDDRTHLLAIEADVIAVGMTVRATDANSATMASSIRKVLVAVVEDGAEKTRPALFPGREDEKAKLVIAARALQQKLETSPEFAQWRAAEREKKLAAFAMFLQTLDQMTGLPTSQVYRAVLDTWRGDRDYLAYLKVIAGLVPHGGAVSKVIVDALEYTDKARKIAGIVMSSAKAAGNVSIDSLAAQATATVASQGKGVLMNTASRFALDRADKQLSYFKDKAEVRKVTDLLAQTSLMRDAMPTVPGLGGGT